MKKALIALAAIATSASALAQGTITFFNNNIINPTTGATYRAGIFADSEPLVFGDTKGDSTVGAGAGITVGLFLASAPTVPLGTATFRTTSAQEVFASAQDLAVTGVPPGATAALLVRAWSTSANSFDNAKLVVGAQWGEQAFTSKPLGGTNPNPPPPSFFTPDMAPFTGFEMETTVVPEPSTIALGALGLGALLIRRRK
jgi:hypothetical protein